jgi:acetyl-CoA C-acetyltransferase
MAITEHLPHHDMQASPEDIVIVGGARTPFARFKGDFAGLSAADLGAHAIRGALDRYGIERAEVDAVIMGQAIQAGAGQNPARQATIGAGLSWSVPAVTINKVCLSGLTAVIDAARLIRSGEARLVVAGGMESMTNGPHLFPGIRQGLNYGDLTAVDSVANDGLTDALEKISMGVLTERGNSMLGISRDDQDATAARSHQLAGFATDDGTLAQEIVPVKAPAGRGQTSLVDADQGIRRNSSKESLATLRTAFAADGTITAGNASPLSDGAAVLVVASRRYADDLGLPVLAVVGSPGQVAGPDDNSLHSQPSNALSRALDRAGWSAGELDFLEINEAFGAVVVQSLTDLGYPTERTNIHGGAIALGHPLGASGARLVLHAALELNRRGGGRAGVALCGGGGQGEALLLYRERSESMASVAPAAGTDR